MITLILLALLFGAILGQFFKVVILFPADAVLILFILVASAYSNDGLASVALKIAVLIPSNAVGYALGQSVFHIPDLWHWLRTHRALQVKSRRLSFANRRAPPCP
jgi:hypothetical protein